GASQFRRRRRTGQFRPLLARRRRCRAAEPGRHRQPQTRSSGPDFPNQSALALELPMTQLRPRRSNRRKLLISCASLAIATAAISPKKADAQAFNGTPTTTSGSVSYARANPNVETITISSSTAKIDWAADDGNTSGTLNFQPSANTAIY